MSLATEVTDAAGNVLAPIASNTVNQIVKGIREVINDDLLKNLSGKEITVTIKIPDLTKDA